MCQSSVTELNKGPLEPLSDHGALPTDFYVGQFPGERSSPDGKGLRRDKGGGKQVHLAEGSGDVARVEN